MVEEERQAGKSLNAPIGRGADTGKPAPHTLFTEIEKMLLCSALFNLAEEKRQASESYKKQGFPGISFALMADAIQLMQLKDKVAKL